MHALAKVMFPPTAVEHALCCDFINHSPKSLVVAGANVLRVFQLIPDISVSSKGYHQYTESNPPKMKMECLAEFTLFGNIMSMHAVSLADSSHDALLLSFKDAKLSLVEYNVETHDLQTLSLHYFEDAEMRDGWVTNHEIPIVRVDPENRCAAMLVYGRRLVILPFRIDTLLEEPEVSNVEADEINIGSNQVLSSYTIIWRDIEHKIDNVIDMQFLHGYYEPTLLILYEPVKAFPGRLAVRRDTCCMVTISLNIQQKVHPVIWSLSNLPFDCTKVIAVNKPIGGALIFAVNSVIYINQCVPPYGVALNSLAEQTTSFPLKRQEGIKITLDGAQSSFLTNDKLVISLSCGELYVMALFVDNMRSVRSFHFEKAAASVLTSCTCVIEDNFLFLGSRLGNSLLLKFSTKEQNALAIAEVKSFNYPPAKKKKMESLGDCMASNVSDIRDVDALEVYGNEKQASVMQITSYIFEVCDTLLNIGPCGVMAMGEPAFLSEEFSNNLDPDVELVTTSGHGKNGAICIIQQSVRPQVITTFKLPDYADMWTVLGNNSSDDHAFMILSQKDSTMVLQTGREINEIDHSGFDTTNPTIFAGNLGNNKFVVQVGLRGVRLVQGSDQVQYVPLDIGSPLIHASCADPHLVVLTENGQLVLLTWKELKQGVGRLKVQRPTNFNLKPQVVTLCLYRDISGLFCHSVPESERRSRGIKKEKNLISALRSEVEDEDELLYGESGPQTDIIAQSASDLMSAHWKGVPWWKKYIQPIKSTTWLFVVRENGHLEIYSVPNFLLSYLITDITGGLSILSDSLGVVPLNATNQENLDVPRLPVREILVAPLGNNGRRPVLIIRSDNEVLVYQAYRYLKGSLKVRFKKSACILTRDTVCRSRDENDYNLPTMRSNRIRYFNDIAGYSGVFISGYNPQWLFLTASGKLRVHPMNIDGPIQCFAEFHNVNCPRGFLYFNFKGELRICILPTHLSYDSAWLIRKVPLRCTAHFLTYHLESKTYCTVISRSKPTSTYYRFNGEDKELSFEQRDADFALPSLSRFSTVLFSPVSWELIANTEIELDDWEHVICLKNVSLAYEGTRSGLKGYIVLGTNYNYSEEITSRGRIIIYDIIEVVPEPGQPLSKNKMKVIYAKEQKGPVTAVANTASGFLVSAIGQKIYIWQLKDNDLVGIAFIDTHIYIHQMISLKSLILVGDVFKSITLLRFQEEYRTLSLVSRDYRPGYIYSADFMIDNSQVGFLVSDKDRNLVTYMYLPEARESVGGQRLLRKADYHLGQHINTFFRIRCKKSLLSAGRRQQLESEKRQITMFATLDGTIGYVLPVTEKNYRRLLMLQNVLSTHISHTAGLNPRDFRMYKTGYKVLGNVAKSIVDGELIFSFILLSQAERSEIAKKIGVKMDDILEDLYEIQQLTTLF